MTNAKELMQQDMVNGMLRDSSLDEAKFYKNNKNILIEGGKCKNQVAIAKLFDFTDALKVAGLSISDAFKASSTLAMLQEQKIIKE